MQLTEAVQQRITDICNEQNITLNKLSKKANLTFSTVYTIFYEKNSSPKLSTIQHICEGLNIDLSIFFNDPMFERKNLEKRS